MSAGPRSIPLGPRVPLMEISRLLMALTSEASWQRYEEAIAKFRLDRNNPADVSAAVVYAQAKEFGFVHPRIDPAGKQGGNGERVAEALMRMERANPGTMANAGVNAVARARVESTIAEAAASGPLDEPEDPGSIVFYRKNNVAPQQLSTTSSVARARTVPKPNFRWRAHHLIPFAVVDGLPPPTQRAIAASNWEMDSTENLIALPADQNTFNGIGGVLPYHSSNHPIYSGDVGAHLATIGVVTGAPQMQAPALRLLLFNTEQLFEQKIKARLYHNRIAMLEGINALA